MVALRRGITKMVSLIHQGDGQLEMMVRKNLVLNAVVVLERGLKAIMGNFLTGVGAGVGAAVGTKIGFDPTVSAGGKKVLTTTAKLVGSILGVPLYVTTSLTSVSSVRDVIASCANPVVGNERAAARQIDKGVLGRIGNIISKN